MGQRLEVRVDRIGEWDAVVAIGEVDIGTTDVITAAIEEAGRRLVVDLTGATFMDSSGLATLMAAHNARAEEGSLAVVCREGSVRRLLQVSGVDRVIAVIDDLAALPDA